MLIFWLCLLRPLENETKFLEFFDFKQEGKKGNLLSDSIKKKKLINIAELSPTLDEIELIPKRRRFDYQQVLQKDNK